MALSAFIVIIALTAIISFWGFSDAQKQSKLLMYPYRIHHNKEWYRFLSSGFAHADLSHLGFNMLTFVFFAPYVEQYYVQSFGTLGYVVFVLIYLAMLVISDLPTYFKYKNDYRYTALGASGAVSGIVFISILLNPVNRICLYGILCFPGFILGLVYVGYSYYQSKNSNDNTNHSAHLYGAISGLVIAIVLEPKLAIHFVNRLSDWFASF